MAKAAVNYACTECGYSAGRWFGKCPGCDAFGSLVEGDGARDAIIDVLARDRERMEVAELAIPAIL